MITATADGLYALLLTNDLGARVLGGPYRDIDLVLNDCFDEILGANVDRRSVFYAEVRNGVPTVLEFPDGAFPGDPGAAQWDDWDDAAFSRPG